MPEATIGSVRIAGIGCAIPDQTATLRDHSRIFGAVIAESVFQNTGIARRPVCPPEVCTSDLCVASAQFLLDELNWPRDTIDGLVFVSQTPDYRLPATACVIHERLELSTSCAAFDMNQGCSGYVYGLWSASQMLAGGGCQRVLLLVGDTVNRMVAPEDRAAAMLFGDAGTATALERDASAPPLGFKLGTDGTGWKHLIVPAGGSRQQADAAATLRTTRDDGNARSDADLYMNGPEVFAFTLREVPKLVSETLARQNWSLESIDAVVFHQANGFIVKRLAKRLQLPEQKVLISLDEFGNTSSASIPMTLVSRMRNLLEARRCRVLLVGFGVGFSWGCAAVELGPLVLPALQVLAGRAPDRGGVVTC